MNKGLHMTVCTERTWVHVKQGGTAGFTSCPGKLQGQDFFVPLKIFPAHSAQPKGENKMAHEIPYKIYLNENEMPTAWYNLRADMKTKPAPLLNPGTHQPMSAGGARRCILRMSS